MFKKDISLLIVLYMGALVVRFVLLFTILQGHVKTQKVFVQDLFHRAPVCCNQNCQSMPEQILVYIPPRHHLKQNI